GLLYTGVLGLFAIVLVATPTLRFADIAGEPEKQVLHYEEGVAGVVKVATDIYDRKLLSINGWSVAGTGTPNLDVALVNDFPEVNHNVLTDPRLHVTIDDGRNYLLVTPETYDVVSVDTLDPKHAGNGNLYTREFYELSKRVLKPGGIFVQWLPYHQVDNASLKMIARTFQHVYPHATMWLNRLKGHT